VASRERLLEQIDGGFAEKGGVSAHTGKRGSRSYQIIFGTSSVNTTWSVRNCWFRTGKNRNTGTAGYQGRGTQSIGG